MSNLKVPYSGRSTSQISIYDYPEHLNPFYEDENHKRIRFWHIGKNKNNGINSRRGSFSLNGIKEMWAFKSFRLKKKSSNLGINKTSESPPPLRRALDENHYGTYDARMRHTVGNNTLNDNFLRNVPYRTSLQDMRSTQKIEQNNNDFAFERNNRYRSTMQTTMRDRIFASSEGVSPQVPPRRYVYGGSVTPQPRLRSNDFNEDYSGISRGSSQMSITNKNPFEEDDDVVIGKISSSESKTTEKHKRHVKKKRRAPPPPVPIPKVIDEELRVAEADEDVLQESAQITNLACEIQNFVKSVDECSKNDLSENVEMDIIAENRNSINVKEDNTLLVHNRKVEVIKEQINVDTEKTVLTGTNPPSSETRENVCVIENTFEKVPDTTEILNKEYKLTKEKEKDDFNLNNNETLSASKIDNSTIAIKVPSPDVKLYLEQPIELKITESIEDLSERSEKIEKSEILNETNKEITLVSLNDEEVKKCNTDIQNNEYRSQQNRRRSVREIIESINRNQKLLRINQTQNENSADNDLNIKAPPRRKYNLKEGDQNLDGVDESEEEIESVINEMEAISRTETQNEDSIITDDILRKLSDVINNNEKECETFKKCEVKKEINRESSPISSNLDWNPVPKPKRIKKLSIELQKTNSVPNDSKDNF